MDTPSAEPVAPSPKHSLVAALRVFIAGMAVLFASDVLLSDGGTQAEDRAVAQALAQGDVALGAITAQDPILRDDDDTPAQEREAERFERAQSARFFLEQAAKAWSGEEASGESEAVEQPGAELFNILKRLWVLGWLWVPLALVSWHCALWRSERDMGGGLRFALESTGWSAFAIALVAIAQALVLPAYGTLAVAFAALVPINALLFARATQLDRAQVLLRSVPLIAMILVGVLVMGEILLRVGLVG